MSLEKQHKPHLSSNRSNDAFIRPSVSQIIQMNKDNPGKTITSANFEPQTKLNHRGDPLFIQPMHTVQARLGGLKSKEEGTSSSKNQSPNAKNKNGLPNNLQAGAERLSGHNMDDVKVHYNSPKPREIGAHAYAQGTEIHLASGQEKHLPHEAWHIVQQKQGRVTSGNYQAEMGPVNNDRKLESEADRMGAKMTNSNNQLEQQNKVNTNARADQSMIQRKEVPTNFGKFETPKFEGVDNKGVSIILKFHPDETKVDAKKIALTQSVRSTNESGEAFAIDPNEKNRMVKKGDSGGGYKVDRLTDRDNPIYGAKSLGTGKDLKDTPTSNNALPDVGPFKTYELGHCYKLKPDDAKKDKHSAGLHDAPSAAEKKGRSMTFETTALAIEGADKDTYYGSVKWGYKMEGTDAVPTLTKFDITEASKGEPTKNFTEPAKLWNSAKTRGTLKVSADPEANVLLNSVVDGKIKYTSMKLAKDTELKQIKTVSWGSDSGITCKVLTGPHKDKKITIKNKDVVDMGNGTANKKLPLK
jgi:hypothetical protein